MHDLDDRLGAFDAGHVGTAELGAGPQLRVDHGPLAMRHEFERHSENGIRGGLDRRCHARIGGRLVDFSLTDGGDASVRTIHHGGSRTARLQIVLDDDRDQIAKRRIDVSGSAGSLIARKVRRRSRNGPDDADEPQRRFVGGHAQADGAVHRLEGGGHLVRGLHDNSQRAGPVAVNEVARLVGNILPELVERLGTVDEPRNGLVGIALLYAANRARRCRVLHRHTQAVHGIGRKHNRLRVLQRVDGIDKLGWLHCLLRSALRRFAMALNR